MSAFRITFLCALSLGFLTFAAAADLVPYATGSWSESGFGNHRAIVHIAAQADAVCAHIEWRRHDPSPQTKDIRVYDLATNQRVMNVVRAGITPEAGDIVFQPATAPGDYAVYYLPYTAPQGNFDNAGEYYPPQETADAAWCERNGLTAAGLATGNWRKLPPASLVRIEARTDFDRGDPMEVVATPDEIAGLLNRVSNATYLAFPADRKFPIRMLDDLPQRWIAGPPRETFTGDAQPGEYYCLQIGVWAARKPISSLALDLTELKGDKGAAIPRDQITCFNLGGTDWLGRTITKTVKVPQGRVQPLWIGIQVPHDAAGIYTGTFTVRPAGAEARPVRVQLRVAGPVLADGGVGDLSRMSRLKWLNSTLCLDDGVVPPYTPLQVRGNTVSCLLRQVRFGALGLPESIVSSQREILAAPLGLTFATDRGALAFRPEKTQVPKLAPGAVERVTVSRAADADLTVKCKMEADGCLTYGVTLDPHRTLKLSDVRLQIPQRRDCAPYMMGLGKRGGFRPAQWRWKWDHSRANNMVWVGDVTAGMQLQLRPDQDVWNPVVLTSEGFALAWDNGGKGGCDVSEAGDRVLVQAYTGDRVLQRGRRLELHFRLLITPFKPIDGNHWNWRYGDTNSDGTIMHVHHGTAENPYINYPFLTVPLFTDLVKAVKTTTTRQADQGELNYPAAGNFNPQRGAVHLWTTIDFDTLEGGASQSKYNRPLFHVSWPDESWLGFYWNIDDRGMRAYVSTMGGGARQFPVLIPSYSPEWRHGEKHLITLTWGDEFAIYVDGQKKAGVPYKGTLGLPLDGVRLGGEGTAFIVHALKMTDEPYTGAALPTPTLDDHTLLLDDFAKWDAGHTTHPLRAAGSQGGTVTGISESKAGGLHLTYREEPAPRKGVNIYDNVGQVSNHMAEIWAVRSLGDEIMPITSTSPSKVGDTVFGTEGGGYPWLREHLVSGYVPGWRQPLPWLGQTDASLEMQGLSRWHNYYVEGFNWMMRTTGVDGLYLDGISYDREIMKRIAKVMYRNDPGSRMNCHGGDCWSCPWDPDRLVSTANAYMEHFPYLTNLWFGEQYDYNMPPDFWLIEVSGIPFGLTGEMLNENGGNPYRGMIYGMSARQHPGCAAMWRYWDKFGIQDAEWLGYWNPKCPVKTDNPSVFATVYRKPGKSLISLAHWPTGGSRLSATAHQTATPPAIDGTFAPGEWDQAAKLTGFIIHDGTERAPDQTEVFVTSDRERLYLAFRCAQPGGIPKATARQRDGSVWEDDAVELFLQPDPQMGTYYQFIGNSAGAIYDAKGSADAGWNGDWTYKTSVAGDSWTGELSIPLASLGVKPGAGDTTIGLNICRDQQLPAPRTSCWSPISGSFHNPAQFGRLTLSATGASTRQDAIPGTGKTMLNVRLLVDWKALGLNPKKAKLSAPSIEKFQSSAEYAVDQPIPIEAAKGALLVVHE